MSNPFRWRLGRLGWARKTYSSITGRVAWRRLWWRLWWRAAARAEHRATDGS